MLIDTFPASPPPEVLAQVAAALTRSAGLVAQGFSIDAVRGRISPGQLLDLADGSITPEAILNTEVHHVDHAD